jgi:hypothetical protein
MPAIEMAAFDCVSPACFPVIEMAGFRAAPLLRASDRNGRFSQAQIPAHRFAIDPHLAMPWIISAFRQR